MVDGAGAGAGAGGPNIVLAAKGWQSAAFPADENPTMSDDGQYVFFESPVALAPGGAERSARQLAPGSK
jgi:hypothetical protein